MIEQTFRFLKPLSCLVLTAFTVCATLVSQAQAAISEQDNQLHSNVSPVWETRDILDQASFLAFQGASAVQKIQTLSVDTITSELLKDYMASMIYIPQAMALPTDEEALDEPWAAAFISPMAYPTRDPKLSDDEPVDAKAIDFGNSTDVKKFLTLLKPVQNAFVSSPFGFRWGRPHQGVDLAAPTGTPIISAEDGRVVYSGWKEGYGNFVAIDHGFGYQTHYAHCSKILVRNGQSVKKGGLIAKVGNTGRSTGPHLHFEVVANGIHRNPEKFINQRLSLVKAD